MIGKVEDKIYRFLGQYDGFYTRPPLDMRKKYIADKVICLNNDGGENWIGTTHEWHTHFKNRDFKKICIWFIWQWSFVDWFGLRSFIWYKLLKRKCYRASADRGRG